jgi:serine/threonine-protein kinase
VLDSRAAAYLCDGRYTEAWLKGSAGNGRVVLRGGHGSRLTARLTDDGRLEGTFTIKDKDYSFSIKSAQKPAGLYRAKSPGGAKQTTIGWIVLPDGSQVGVRTVNGVASPAPTLEPGVDVVVDGQRLIPQPVTGNAEVS